MTCHAARRVSQFELRLDRDRREVWRALASTDALAEIDAAVTRLAAGKFGLCEACALPIPLGRLRAVPTARLCVTCEEREEQANQRSFKT
jgi:RNA polymerase-binding transcription factor DksA